MPYTQNTSGTTGDGILQALSDIALGEDHRPYVTNTSGVTLNALLTVLTDVAFGSVTALVRNTTGTLLDIAIDALVAIRDGDTVPAFNPALYGNTTMAGFVARLVDVANGSDSSPYPALNTSGVTLNGWVEALDEAIANGTIGEAHLVLSANTVAENASNGTTVGTASIAGDYTGTPSYSLTDDAGGKFAINSSSGVVTKAAALDYETATSHSITVAVSGTTPDPDNRSFTINVTNVVEDTTPDAFELGSAVTGASLSTRVYTAPITISGTDGPNDLVIDGTATSKEYRINGGAWLPVSGTLPQVVNSDVVEASGLTSGSYSTAITISVTAGGNVTSATTDTFTVTTEDDPDLTTLAAPTLDLADLSDSGSSSTDNLTNLLSGTLNVSAPAALAGDTFRLYKSLVEIASDVWNGTDPIAFSGVSFAAGANDYTVTYERPGALSTMSATLTITYDGTAPTLSNPTGTKTGTTTATITVDVAETGGDLFWVADQNTTTPSGAQVIAGQDQGGTSADKSGSSLAVGSTGTKTFNLTGLTSGATYKGYFAYRDAAGNVSTVSATSTFTTDSSAMTTANPASANLFHAGSGFTYSGFTFAGGATIVNMTWDTAVSVTSMTIKGVTATLISDYAGGGIWYANVTAGAGDIVVTMSGTLGCYVPLTKIDLIGGASAPTDYSMKSQAAASPAAWTAKAVPAGGVGVAFFNGLNIAGTSVSGWTDCDGSSSLATEGVAPSNLTALNIKTGVDASFNPTLTSPVGSWHVTWLVTWGP